MHLPHCVWLLLREIGEHDLKASPANPFSQEQMVKWFVTVQMALIPHVFGQGSTHSPLTQASFLKQSVFKIHSGLQPVLGSPM